MGHNMPTFSQLEKSHQRRGGFGKVWKVKQKQTSNYYALKEMSKLRIIDKRSEHSIMSERDLLASMNHSFIVNMNYAFQDYDNLYLVMDLLTGGDLRYQLFKYKKFNEETTRFFIACLILGLEYIHSKKILHRDIKPENLVCDKEGYVRITDFGVAKAYQKNNAFETSGTPGYMAPEVLFGLNHSYQVDYFAIGVIAYEFMIGLRPYLGRTRKDIRDLVLNKQVDIKECDLLPGWSVESADFINKLLLRKPNQRLGSNGIDELKTHPWMKQINWNDLLNHKLPSPFIPENTDNFDRKYCEAIEKIGEETNERYKEYVNDQEYTQLFQSYNFLPKGCLSKNDVTKEKSNDRLRQSSNNTMSSMKQSKKSSTRASLNESLNNLMKVELFKIAKLKVHTALHSKSKDKSKNKDKDKTKHNNENKNMKDTTTTTNSNNTNMLLGKSTSMKTINQEMGKTISVFHSNTINKTNNNMLNYLNKHRSHNSHYNKSIKSIANNNYNTNPISKLNSKTMFIQLSDSNKYTTTSSRIRNGKLSPFNTLNIAKSQEHSSFSRSPITGDRTKNIKEAISRNCNGNSNNINSKTKSKNSLYTIKLNQNLPLLSLNSHMLVHNSEHNTIVSKTQDNKKNNKTKTNTNKDNTYKVNKNVFKQQQQQQRVMQFKPQKQYESIQVFHQGHASQLSYNASRLSPLLIDKGINNCK